MATEVRYLEDLVFQEKISTVDAQCCKELNGH